MRINVEQLSHGEGHGSGQFYDTQVSSFLQHPAHLRQSLVQVGKVADAKGSCHCIKGVVRVGEVGAILFLKADDMVHSPFLHLFPSYLHHTLRDVCSDQLLWVQHLRC